MGGVRALAKDLVTFPRRPVWILVYVPVALTLLEYVFLPARSDAVFPSWRRVRPGTHEDLARYAWWSGGCLLLMVVLPSVMLRLVDGARPRELGLRLRGTAKDAPVYAVLLLVFAPVVWLVSHRSDFRAVYPFFKPAAGAASWDFVAFEAAYALQFLAVEYFFRGVMVLGLKPALGRASVLVMLAPYCMIHYHKPLPEALGAIGAGAVLGCLSWRTGTVVYGWFLHYAVALSMDLLALAGSGRT